MKSLKGYDKHIGGKKCAAKRVTVYIPESTTTFVMEKLNTDQRTAELKILAFCCTNKSVECCGIQWDSEMEMLASDETSNDENRFVMLDSPVIDIL